MPAQDDFDGDEWEAFDQILAVYDPQPRHVRTAILHSNRQQILLRSCHVSFCTHSMIRSALRRTPDSRRQRSVQAAK